MAKWNIVVDKPACCALCLDLVSAEDLWHLGFIRLHSWCVPVYLHSYEVVNEEHRA